MTRRPDPVEDYELEAFASPKTERRSIFAFVIIVAVAVALLIWAGVEAFAHQAPSGWNYPASCCHNRDCGQVPADWIEEGADGITVLPTGEQIPYSDTRIKDSPDGLTHWCRNPDEPKPHTICVYLPPRGF